MRPFFRFVKWFLLNGLFVWLLYSGFIKGGKWQANLFGFLFWWVVVISTLAMIVTLAKERRLVKRGLPVPQWMSIGYDILLASALAALGHGIMAGWWIWQAVCECIIFDPKRPVAEDAS